MFLRQLRGRESKRIQFFACRIFSCFILFFPPKLFCQQNLSSPPFSHALKKLFSEEKTQNQLPVKSQLNCFCCFFDWMHCCKPHPLLQPNFKPWGFVFPDMKYSGSHSRHFIDTLFFVVTSATSLWSNYFLRKLQKKNIL